MDTIIYHYTNIDVLALMLKNRTLRFNRLDHVDDPEESNFISNGVNLGPYTFVSCWTEAKEESRREYTDVEDVHKGQVGSTAVFCERGAV